MLFRQLCHLIGGRCIAGHINGLSVRKGQDITDTFTDAVIRIIPGLDRFHGDIAQVEVPVLQGFLLCDHPAVIAAFRDQIHLVVIVVVVGHQDQIRRQVISFPRVRIDIDDLVISGHDADAGMAHVKQGRRFSVFVSISHVFTRTVFASLCSILRRGLRRFCIGSILFPAPGSASCQRECRGQDAHHQNQQFPMFRGMIYSFRGMIHFFVHSFPFSFASSTRAAKSS